ncbi:MAG: CinA family protein, partial [Calditrichaeota bacterium]|nr:CinA family protein [Calditrichota bacterium]
LALLGVKETTLQRFGAVSAETAQEMAEGLRQRMGCDVAISTTGIAGPGGATPDKPVGLMYAGLATAERSFAVKFLLGKERLINKERGAQAALEMLRRELLGIKQDG